MRRETRRPYGAIVSAVAALTCAAPTLVLPADSSIAPKLAFAAVGAVLFGIAVVRTRSEGTPPGDHDETGDGGR